MKKTFFKLFFAAALPVVAMTACSDDDSAPVYQATVTETLPTGYTMTSASINFTEINTGAVITSTNPSAIYLPAGTYNIDGTAQATDADGNARTLRTVEQNVVITDTQHSFTLSWFVYDTNSSLIFSELYISGSLNDAGKGCIFDQYFVIYNNTDEVQYADGLLLCESALNNATAFTIKTAGSTPEESFSTVAIYQIPGNGTDVPIQPGKSIKIANNAIDYSAQTINGLNNTDADFEIYDESQNANNLDQQNPDVPDMAKWYANVFTFFTANQQCNSSYILAKVPAGMTSDQYLEAYETPIEYTMLTVAGSFDMTKTVYKIPNEWIIDGVNLCMNSTYKASNLSPVIDMSHASIAEDSAIGNRAGKTFKRKQAAKSNAGNIILQDTNDSANDFEVVNVK